jgi:hypothetical protein
MRSRTTDRNINPWSLPDCTVPHCRATAHTVSNGQAQHWDANENPLPETPADEWEADMLRARTQDVADYTNQTGNPWPGLFTATARRTAP